MYEQPINSNEGTTPEEEERYAFYMKNNPPEVIPEEKRENPTSAIEEVKELLAIFETNHPLDQLNAIFNLSAEDAPKHPVREPARKDLVILREKLKSLKKRTSIHPDKYAQLWVHYVPLSRAVGIINGGKVEHDRTPVDLD